MNEREIEILNNNNRILIITTAIASNLLFLGFYESAYGQQQQLQRSMITGSVSPTALQVIESVQAECARVMQFPVDSPTPELRSTFLQSCVFMIYESATTIVLDGDLIIATQDLGFVQNPFIWQAVDEFKTQGYIIDSTSLTGQGSQGNPHKVYVVMSK